MPEQVVTMAWSLGAGALLATGVRFAALNTWAPAARPPAWTGPQSFAHLHDVLEAALERAGWSETPQRLAVLAAVTGSGLATLGLSAGTLFDPVTAGVLAVVGAIGGVGAVGYMLRTAIAGRRRMLTRQLVPLLELFLLELGGGGSAVAALGSVTMQIQSDIAAELRRLLIESQAAGVSTFEPRLRDYADRMQIPALNSLATILTASRDYGTGVSPGVRALALDMRRDQRRELIAQSRRALNHVLFPAAIGVLLPFLAILLFPAVTTLQRNLP